MPKYQPQKHSSVPIPFDVPSRVNQYLLAQHVPHLPLIYDQRYFYFEIDEDAKTIKLLSTKTDQTRSSSEIIRLPLYDDYHMKSYMACIQPPYLYTADPEKLYLIDIRENTAFKSIPLKQDSGINFLNSALIKDSFLVYSDVSFEGRYTLTKFDLEQQKVFWECELESSVRQLTQKGNFIYFQQGKDRIVAKDLRTGETVWEWQTDDRIRLTGLLSVFENQLIQANHKNEIFAIDLESGKLNWSTRVEVNRLQNINLYHDGTIHVLDNEYYACIDARDGVFIKEFTVGFQFEKHQLFSIGDLVVTEDYILSHDIMNAKLFALNKKTGKLDWVYDTNIEDSLPFNNHILLSNHSMSCLDSEGNLYLLESTD